MASAENETGKVKMTVDEALDQSQEWSAGATFHADSQGWRVVCMVLANEVTRLRQSEPLREFVRELFEGFPEELGIDGFDLQDLAIKHGILVKQEPPPAEPCGENCACASYYSKEEWDRGEVTCLHRADILKSES